MRERSRPRGLNRIFRPRHPLVPPTASRGPEHSTFSRAGDYVLFNQPCFFFPLRGLMLPSCEKSGALVRGSPITWPVVRPLVKALDGRTVIHDLFWDWPV